MIEAKFPNRIAAWPKAALAGLTALLVFWACQLNGGDGETRFNLVADSSWTRCHTLLVELQDTSGRALDTLFNDSLKSLDQLNGLDASGYPGGRATVRILGTNADGSVCAEQSRSFDDQGGNVVVDTLALPGSSPRSVTFEPSSLSLKAGDPAATVTARIEPKFADQKFEWSVDDPSVATLDLPDGLNSATALVIPLKNGTARITAKAKQDPSKSAQLVVQVGSVGGRTITLLPDSLDLFLGGPDSVLKASASPEPKAGDIQWSSSDAGIVKVDDKGRVHGVKEGSATVKAQFGEALATARVHVKKDVPVLTVANKPGAAVNAPITFSPKATQQFGAIVMFKFDLDGNGAWDDSLPGPFLGSSVDLPPQTASFAKEGAHKVRFLVRDSEGNEATAEVSVDIGNQPPEVVSKSKDTLVSINDLVPLEAKVRDAEGKVALLGWDYDGDGKLDDSVKAKDSVATLKAGHKYAKAGIYEAILYATDDAGKTGKDSVRIEVVVDAPVADMGPDISIIAGSQVAFSVKGTDKFGAIAKREIKVGSGPYLNLGKQDTSLIVPGDTGKVAVIGRVTDDDGNSDEDTMVVTLIPPSKSNNDLASLVPSAGALTPVFKPVTIAYSLSVGYADSLVSVTALTTDPQATLLINGKAIASGKPSGTVAVPVGTTPKVFEIIVTAQDGNQKTYSVAVTRAPSNDASLSKLEATGFTLKPAFKPDAFGYADTVAFKVASVSLKATSAQPSAKIALNDTGVAAGSLARSLPLDVGDNLFKLTVTAQDGSTKSTYTVKLVRRAKVIVSRVAGGATVQADSLEAPLGTVVTLKAPDTTGFHFSKWALTEGAGTFLDSTANPAKLTVKSATVRALGSFAINTFTVTGTIKGFAGGAFSQPSITLGYGLDTTVTITPLVGYRVLSLTDNGKDAPTLGTADGLGPRTYKLTGVKENHVLEATFLKRYTLTLSASGAGTISPSGTVEVDSGSSKDINLLSGSPSTGVWVSAFTDNATDQVAALTGDRMNSSKYSLSGINANHAIVATFAVRQFTLKVYGSALCVKKVVPCTGINCLINLCLPTKGTTSDSSIQTVDYGSTYNISTADSLGTSPFVKWQRDGADFTGNSNTTITTGPITADVNYTASYRSIINICCLRGTCCVLQDPLPLEHVPVLQSQSIPSPSTLPKGAGSN